MWTRRFLPAGTTQADFRLPILKTSVAATGPNTIRRTQIAVPLYLLMYPFLVIASYYAISQNLHLASPNEAFFAAAIRLLPGWLLGLVAAGASLSGLLVLTGICLAIGPIVTRNLLPNVPESRQKASAKMVIVVYLLPIDLGGFNLGLLCLAVNIAVTAVMNYGSKRKPVHALS